MNTVFKGEPGYFKSRKIKLGLTTLIGIVLMTGIYLTGYMIFQTGKNAVTILAVLVILPTVKFLVQYLMIPWNCNAKKEDYERLKKACQPLKLHCELLITTKEKSFPIIYLVMDKNDNVIVYTDSKKADETLFETGVHNFMNYYEADTKVKMYKDLGQFEKKISMIARNNKNLTGEDIEHMDMLFEKLSIMSI